jgi:glutathione S-transferase
LPGRYIARGMTENLPILYSFRRCPYAMRARMALLISGIKCELREVKLSAKPEAMVAASPKATVPVLVRTDNVVLDESLQIMRWTLGVNDPEGWLKGDDAPLIEANDGPFKHHLDRYKYPSRYDDCDAVEHREAGLEILRDLEKRLSDQPQLCGEQRSMADIAIMPFVRQFAHTDREWFAEQPVPHLRQWLEAHIRRPTCSAPQWSSIRHGSPAMR